MLSKQFYSLLDIAPSGDRELTISTEDRRSYQNRVTSFNRQQKEDTCFNRSIQNVFNDFVRDRDDPPVKLSHDTIKGACDYQPGFGATSEPLPESLADHLSPHGYTARIETGVDRSELTDIVEDDAMSLPIVELSESYLHNADGYEVQAGMHGEAIPHTVIVFTVNHDAIQFFDPYEDFYTPPENGGGPPSQLPKSQFYQWWAEGTSRWTMWIEQEPQRTLEQASELTNERQ